PVSVVCVPYWSMRDRFCSLASTNLMHSCSFYRLSFVTCREYHGEGRSVKRAEEGNGAWRSLVLVAEFIVEESQGQQPPYEFPHRLQRHPSRCRSRRRLLYQTVIPADLYVKGERDQSTSRGRRRRIP